MIRGESYGELRELCIWVMRECSCVCLFWDRLCMVLFIVWLLCCFSWVYNWWFLLVNMICSV